MAGLYGVGLKVSEEGIEVLPKAGELCRRVERYRVEEVDRRGEKISWEIMDKGVAVLVDGEERLIGIATRKDVGDGKIKPTQRVVYARKDEDILKVCKEDGREWGNKGTRR